MTFFFQAVVAFILTVLLIVWLRRPAVRFGLLDHPGGRKRHGQTVPLTGGIALVCGFIAALAFSFESLPAYRVLLIGMALLAVVGILDDIGELSPRTKLLAQLVAALFMTSWAGLFLLSLGDLFGRGPIELRHWGIPLTVFAIVSVINAINMLDGLDGLAGGLLLVIFSTFASLAYFACGDVNATKLLIVLIGALLGFLFFNAPWHWRRESWRTFMGDAGSMALGLAVAWFSVDLTQRDGMHIPPALMLWILAVPLLDLFTVTIRRLIRRRDPSLADRGHIHHILMRRGWTPRSAASYLVFSQAGLASVGCSLWMLGAPQWLLFASFLMVATAFTGIFLFPGRWLRRRRSNSRFRHN